MWVGLLCMQVHWAEQHLPRVERHVMRYLVVMLLHLANGPLGHVTAQVRGSMGG